MEANLKRFGDVLETITEASFGVGECVKKISSMLDAQFDPSEGISFLEVKAHTQLSYLKNLALLVLKKANGRSIQSDLVIDRLTELRTVCERMRSVEQKLQYQIDKTIQSLKSNVGIVGEGNPLCFKPHPEELSEDGDEDLNSETESEEKREQHRAANRKYVPPKLIAAPYTEPRVRKVEKLRRRIINTGMLQDLRKQYSQAPEEIKGRQSPMEHHKSLEQQQKTEYEEDHFIRLRQPKGQANMRSIPPDSLAGVLAFSGYLASSSGMSKKKRSSGSRRKKSTKKRRKKTH